MTSAIAIVGLIAGMAVLLAFVVGVGREVLDLGGLIGYFLTPLSVSEQKSLEGYSPYYKGLPDRRRREFATRVKHFIYEKNWVGKDIGVTREMQLRIAATATQVTMGFDRLLLLHFTNILILPDSYVDIATGKRLFGGTMPGRRTIAISWKHFMQGADDAGDGRHLGLHELAHALWLENRIPNQEDDFLDKAALEEWRALAEEESARIRRGQGGLFREYAATDQAEFFAVAVECFFEQPSIFRQKLPDLYDCLVRLLKQDPAAAA